MRIARRIVSGLLFLALGFGQFLLPHSAATVMVLTPLWASFYLGAGLLFDGAYLAITGRAIVGRMGDDDAHYQWIPLALSGLAAGMLMELTMSYFGGRWAYILPATPWGHSFFDDFRFLPLLFFEYVVTMATYAYAVVGGFRLGFHLLPGRHHVATEPRPTTPMQATSMALGLVGLAGFITWAVLIIDHLRTHPWVPMNRSAAPPLPPFHVTFWFGFVGSILVAQAIESLRCGRSSLFWMMRHPPSFLLGLLYPTMLLGGMLEGANLYHDLWEYRGWPWQEVAIDGLPWTAILAWPLQYPLYLSVIHIAHGRRPALFAGELLPQSQRRETAIANPTPTSPAIDPTTDQ